MTSITYIHGCSIYRNTKQTNNIKNKHEIVATIQRVTSPVPQSVEFLRPDVFVTHKKTTISGEISGVGECSWKKETNEQTVGLISGTSIPGPNGETIVDITERKTYDKSGWALLIIPPGGDVPNNSNPQRKVFKLNKADKAAMRSIGKYGGTNCVPKSSFRGETCQRISGIDLYEPAGALYNFLCPYSYAPFRYAKWSPHLNYENNIPCNFCDDGPKDRTLSDAEICAEQKKLYEQMAKEECAKKSKSFMHELVFEPSSRFDINVRKYYSHTYVEKGKANIITSPENYVSEQDISSLLVDSDIKIKIYEIWKFIKVKKGNRALDAWSLGTGIKTYSANKDSIIKTLQRDELYPSCWCETPSEQIPKMKDPPPSSSKRWQDLMTYIKSPACTPGANLEQIPIDPANIESDYTEAEYEIVYGIPNYTYREQINNDGTYSYIFDVDDHITVEHIKSMLDQQILSSAMDEVRYTRDPSQNRTSYREQYIIPFGHRIDVSHSLDDTQIEILLDHDFNKYEFYDAIYKQLETILEETITELKQALTNTVLKLVDKPIRQPTGNFCVIGENISYELEQYYLVDRKQ